MDYMTYYGNNDQNGWNRDGNFINQQENIDPNAGYYDQNNDGGFINQQENVNSNLGYYDQQNSYNTNEYDNNNLEYDQYDHPPDVNPSTNYHGGGGGAYLDPRNVFGNNDPNYSAKKPTNPGAYGNSGYSPPPRNGYGNNDPYYSTNKSINPGGNTYGNSGYPAAPRNGYNNNDPYYSTNKPKSPGSSAYGDSGYSTPYNMSSHSNVRNKNHGNPYTVSSNEPKPSQYSYNTPTRYPPSPVNYPNSPAMRPPYLQLNQIPTPYGGRPVDPYPIKPINPIPGRQVPYGGGNKIDPYSEGAPHKETSSSDYSSTPSSNPGPKPPSNYGYEKPFSPTSTHSSKPFFPEKQSAKPGGIMKYCCCGSCGRTCAIICCILILLLIGIIVAVLLWARPPKVDFLGIVPSPQGLPSYIAKEGSGFDFNLGLRIQVDNPNIIGAKFEMIKAIAFYPGHSDPIGGGNLTNVNIGAKKNTTIDFPFSVNYDREIDPGFAILFDIAQKCGLAGGVKEKLKINYKLTLTYKIIFITIHPSFDKNAEIDCPIKDGQIPNIPGFDLDKLAKDFGGKKNSKRDKRIHKSPILFNK